jgi:hypothetical protein
VYRDYAARKDAGEFGNNPQTRAMRVTIEGGVRIYTAPAEWSRWATTYLAGDDDHDGTSADSPDAVHS